MSSPLNGIWRNLTKILLGLLIAMVGAWAAHTNLRIDKQDEKIAATREQVIENQQAIKYLIRIAEENQTTLREMQRSMAREVRR